jgi:hypothetical protein
MSVERIACCQAFRIVQAAMLPAESTGSTTGRHIAIAIVATMVAPMVSKFAEQSATVWSTTVAFVDLAANRADQDECRRGKHSQTFHRGNPFQGGPSVQ